MLVWEDFQYFFFFFDLYLPKIRAYQRIDSLDIYNLQIKIFQMSERFILFKFALQMPFLRYN